MKKLWLFLALLLLLGGCKEAPAETEPTEPQLVTIDIYALNDLHGRLTDTDTQPGVDELTTIATYDEGIFARDLVADQIAAGGLS